MKLPLPRKKSIEKTIHKISYSFLQSILANQAKHTNMIRHTGGTRQSGEEFKKCDMQME